MIARCVRTEKKNHHEQALSQLRARRIAEMPLDFIMSPEFTESASEWMEQSSFDLTAESSEGFFDCDLESQSREALSDIPAWLSRLGETPLLSQDEEITLFRRYNFLKYEAVQLRDSLDYDRPNAAVMTRIEKLYEKAIQVKNQIVSANLRLVVSIAKRHATVTTPLYELISDGNLSLMKAVEKFDYTRGNKFSTYATWSLYRNFARSIPDEKKYHQRFYSSDSDLFELREDQRSDYIQDQRVHAERISQIGQFMNELDERERTIIQRRYGLGEFAGPQTLRQVGKEMGVTKERIRQIETRALAKLRKAARENRLEMPDYY